jgi:sporulation protein YlmC with PRC-barrel domain
MKKFSFLLSLTILVAMLLSACSGATTGTETPGFPEPGAMTETPDDLSTEPAATDDMSLTPSVEPTVGIGDVTPTVAMSPTESITATGVLPPTGAVNIARLTNQLDLDVWTQEGDQIGEVEDIVLDLDQACTTYVIVGIGGFLDLGEKMIAVPWDRLELQGSTGSTKIEDQNAFVLTFDKEALENAPEIDLDNDLPEVGADAVGWDTEISTYWDSVTMTGTTQTKPTDVAATPVMTKTEAPMVTSSPGITETQGMTEGLKLQGVILATDALGYGFRVRGDEDLAVSVDDVIVDPKTCEIKYVVLNADLDDVGERLIPVPLGSLSWDPVDQVYILDTDRVALVDAPYFADGIYPDVMDPDWDADYSPYWDTIILTP